MSSNEWVQLAQTGGVALCMLVVFVMAAGKFAKWAGERFDRYVDPLVKKHIELIDRLIKATDALVDAQTEAARQLQSINQRFLILEQQIRATKVSPDLTNGAGS